MEPISWLQRIDHDVFGGLDLSDPASLLENVQNALTRHASTDVFAVGGAIDLNQTSESVTIRWDTASQSNDTKVSFPLVEAEAPHHAFQQLLRDCQPATFGRGQEEVLDTDYRKASKMEEANFCANFNLAEHQIMNTIVQALAQGLRLGTSDVINGKGNGVIARLYSLNIYSAPSGKFKAHVDTPRSESQMGSLVVCLPHPHEGGELAVRHGGKESIFDWSKKSARTIQWAAFFSDCEHEVLEVTKGHRITLTYNLFWTEGGPSLMATRSDALDPRSLHFFMALNQLYRCPSFLPNGGRIGFACTHAYPHTSGAAIPTLRENMKGLDMAVYQALQKLNTDVRVLAVLNTQGRDECWEEEDEYSDWSTSSVDEKVLAERSYLSTALRSTIVDTELHDGFNDPNQITRKRRSATRPGTWERVRCFPETNVVWLNTNPRHSSFKELAATHLAWGNEPTLDTFYSAAVIVSKVPAFETRKARWATNV